MCGLHRSADCWTLSHRREPAETKEGFLTFSDRSPRGYGGGIDDHFDIRNAVIGRVAIDEREALSLRLFVEYFDRLDQPFSETADPVHVTGSAIVIGSRGVVLHLHKRLGIWLQPGGHIELGESPWQAALRETSEETGLAVTHPATGPELVHVDVHPGPRGHTHLDLRYLLYSGDADPNPPPGESAQVRWFAWRDAIDIADPGLVGALRCVWDRIADSER